MDYECYGDGPIRGTAMMIKSDGICLLHKSEAIMHVETVQRVRKRLDSGVSNLN